jgi:hypothetical protein
LKTTTIKCDCGRKLEVVVKPREDAHDVATASGWKMISKNLGICPRCLICLKSVADEKRYD